MERIVVDLRSGDDRRPLVEQVHQATGHARLSLAALTQEDDVLAGEDRILDLGNDRFFVPHDVFEHRFIGAQPGDEVLPHLLANRQNLVAAFLQLTKRLWKLAGCHGRWFLPSARLAMVIQGDYERSTTAVPRVRGAWNVTNDRREPAAGPRRTDSQEQSYKRLAGGGRHKREMAAHVRLTNLRPAGMPGCREWDEERAGSARLVAGPAVAESREALIRRGFATH